MSQRDVKKPMSNRWTSEWSGRQPGGQPSLADMQEQLYTHAYRKHGGGLEVDSEHNLSHPPSIIQRYWWASVSLEGSWEASLLCLHFIAHPRSLKTPDTFYLLENTIPHPTKTSPRISGGYYLTLKGLIWICCIK